MFADIIEVKEKHVTRMGKRNRVVQKGEIPDVTESQLGEPILRVFVYASKDAFRDLPLHAQIQYAKHLDLAVKFAKEELEKPTTARVKACFAHHLLDAQALGHWGMLSPLRKFGIEPHRILPSFDHRAFLQGKYNGHTYHSAARPLSEEHLREMEERASCVRNYMTLKTLGKKDRSVSLSEAIELYEVGMKSGEVTARNAPCKPTAAERNARKARAARAAKCGKRLHTALAHLAASGNVACIA